MLTRWVLGKSTSTPLPSVDPTDQLPQVLYDFFGNKVRQIRDSIDRQVVHPPSYSLCEWGFSGTPVCGFGTVIQEDVLKCIKKNVS